MITTLFRRAVMAGLILVVLPATGVAASFQVLEHSTARLGTAYAGTASAITDATTAFFNPAGMARLEGRTLSAGGSYILVDAAFDDNGSTAGTGTALERPLAGVGGETDEPAVVPNLFYVNRIDDDTTFGLGMTAPFGLTSDYGEEWQGRYHATRSELRVININPTFAHEVNDRFSVGFGASFQRIDTTLENELDSFNLCRQAGGSSANCATAHGGPGNRASDSSVKIEGDDEGLVFDLSMHWQASSRTELGASWRQGGDYTLHGDGEFVASQSCDQDPFCSGALAALEGDVRAEASLPDTLTVSASHRINRFLDLHADIAWTRWSVLQSIVIENMDNGQTLDELELEYDDTMRYALGASHSAGGRWTWRAGVAFDEAPQTDRNLITPRIPDADRSWLSFGFNYAYSEDASVDFGYARLFIDDIRINSSAQGNTLQGEFEPNADILAIQANWRY